MVAPDQSTDSRAVMFCPRCGRAMTLVSSQCPRCLVAAVTGGAASPTLRRPSLPLGIERISNVLIFLSILAFGYLVSGAPENWFIGMVLLVSVLCATLAIGLRYLVEAAYWLLALLLGFVLWWLGKDLGFMWWFSTRPFLVLLIAVLLFFLLGHLRIYHDAVEAEAIRHQRLGEDHSKRQLALAATIGAELVLLMGWAAMPSVKTAVYAKIEARREAICRTNLKRIATALLKYAESHDGKLPPTKDPLSKVLAPYLADPRMFRCPKDDDQQGAGYLFNPELAGWPVKNIVDPATTILLSEDPVRHRPESRHRSGGHYALVDGTVKLLFAPSWQDEFKWVPDERISEAAATSVITRWKKAWEERNAEALIAFYPPGYQGEATDHESWLKQKKESLSRWSSIHLEIENMDYSPVSDGEATVSFTQYYWAYRQSPARSYADIGRKALALKKEHGKPLIVNEHFEEELTKRYPERTTSPESSVGRFVCPGSDVRTLYESDLYGKSAWDLDLMRNEIFARYGMIFKRTDLQKYFLRQGWYFPRPDFSGASLNDIERQNAEFIAAYQRDHDLRTR